MSNDAESRDNLREVEQRADEITREAEGQREENLRATHRGQETDYAFRLPPDMAEADRVRALDDVELTTRQEDVAETQRRAAEALRRNAQTLDATGEALDRSAQAVRDNRRDVGEIRENSDELQDLVSQARDLVDRTEIPRVDPGRGTSGG